METAHIILLLVQYINLNFNEKNLHKQLSQHYINHENNFVREVVMIFIFK